MHPFRLVLLCFCAAQGVLVPSWGAPPEGPKPKYAVTAEPLSRAPREYFKRESAPDFWALMPYYLPQQDGSACSVASVTMVLNAARASLPLGSEDALVTQPGILKKVKHRAWSGALGYRRGVTLDQLGEILSEALKAYGFSQARVDVERVEEAGPASLAKLKSQLEENERSTGDFIILNFLQGVYTGDSPTGHVAPLAAYDAVRGKALVLDPDREWYEPYWVPLQTLLDGMATLDSVSGKNRGWVRARLNAGAEPGASAAPPTKK